MAFPAGLTLVTVTAHIDDFPDGGSTGVVIFAAPYDLVGPVDGSIVPAPYRTVPFETDGTLTVAMPAADAPNWSPADWTYDVTVKFSGGREITGTMALSVDDTSVNLAEVLMIGAAPSPASTYPTFAQLDQRLVAPTARIAALEGANRALVIGESVLNRQDVNGQLAVESGTLFLTHFTAAKTETITKIRTTTGDTPTVAVGGTHAWIGVMEWDGTNYIPRAISVDDPTRWASPFASYETPISTFNKVAGHDYALEILWIGSGNPPQLPARSNWYADVLTEPRLNALLFTQVAPPSSPLSGAFVGPDSRRFQGILLP